MKLVSWNVNGLRACMQKGFLESFAALDADVFCLQETKLQPHQIDLDLSGYWLFWSSAEKKGYSGTALFTRLEPVNVTYGIDDPHHEAEGRAITLELEDCFVVTLYSPDAQDGLKRIDYFLVSRRRQDRIRAAAIHADIYGSDHCPVSLTI